MHLRRALLLFAIVLGLAAIAASISRPRDESETATPRTPAPQTEQTPTAEPGGAAPSGPGSVELTFLATDPEAHRIEAGQAATVYVEVDEPGQVAIPDLGMSAAAEPLTEARFDVLTSTTGRHEILFEPAAAEAAPVKAGTLVVVEAQ